MKKCNKCGKDIKDDAKFCPYCGADQVIAQRRFCSICGKELEPGAKFCSACGTKSDWKETNDLLDFLKTSGVQIEGGALLGFSSYYKESTTFFLIPSGIVRIGDNAFKGWSKLTSVTVPETVIRIGKCAFEECGITSLYLPKSLLQVGERAFRCHNLKSVTFTSLVPPKFDDTWSLFGSSISRDDFKIYVPKAALDAYKNIDDQHWKTFVVEHIVGQ